MEGWLVLQAGYEDEIVIGDPLNPICVLKPVAFKWIHGRQHVRLALRADKSIQINRKKIANRIVEEAKAQTRASA